MSRSQWIRLYVDRLGTTRVGILVSIALIAGLFLIELNTRALSALCALGSTALSVWVCKTVWYVPRPEGALVSIRTSSFPSGHTALAVALALATYLGLSPILTTQAQVYVAVIAFILATGVSLSRIALKVHRPREVFVGLLIGISCTLLSFGPHYAL